MEIKDVEHIELKDKPQLAASLGVGYSISYFDSAQAFKQTNSFMYRDKVNTVGLGSEILGAVASSTQGKFNSILAAGYDRYLSDWVHLFVYSSYESNVIASMLGQLQVGSGGKIVLVKTESLHFDISLAPTYVQTTYTDHPLREDLSVTARTRLRWTIFKNTTLVVPYAFVTALSNANDQWHAINPSLSYLFHENATLETGYRYRYNTFNHTYAGVFYITVAAHLKN
ncbi:MAG: hypothetical protein LDLANPLL_02354 [Turneriella sp.]|nr:hypothetical protein [Turneriella sp.]